MQAARLYPSTDMEMHMPILKGPEGPLFSHMITVVRLQRPAILAIGAPTEAEIDIETLGQRMIDDATASGVVGYFNSGYVGVWARKP